MSGIEGEHNYSESKEKREDKDTEQIASWRFRPKWRNRFATQARRPFMDIRLTPKWAPTLRLADIAYA